VARSCPLCSAGALDLGLVVRREVHLAKVDRLSARWHWGAALLLVASGSAVLLVNNRIESYCEELNNQVAVSTPPPRRVGVGIRHRTHHNRPLGMGTLRAGKP